MDGLHQGSVIVTVSVASAAATTTTRKQKEAIPADNRRNIERCVVVMDTATVTMVILEEWGGLCFVSGK